MFILLFVLLLGGEVENSQSKFDIINHILHLKTPKQSEEAEALIQQLGDLNFQKRENAAYGLRQLDVKACVVLVKHRDDLDPEIKYRTRLLLYNYNLRVFDNYERRIPEIWELPNDLRYFDGYEKDAAKDYYEKSWDIQQDGKAQALEKPEAYIRPKITYKDSEISVYATVQYVADLREKGLEIGHAEVLLNLMIWNKKNLYHVTHDMDYLDNGGVPSCLLTRRVKEGIFWNDHSFDSFRPKGFMLPFFR